MKYLILTIHILMHISLFTMAQEYPVIDTLNFRPNVKEVYKYVLDTSEIDTTIIEKYHFNRNGKHVITYSGYNRETQIKTVYNYVDSKLINIQKYEYESPKNARITNQYYEEFNQIMDSVSFENYD